MRRCMEVRLVVNLLLAAAVTQTNGLLCERRPAGISVPESDPDGRFVIEVAGNPTTYVPGEKYTIFLRGIHTSKVQHKFTNFLLAVESTHPEESFSSIGEQSVGTLQLFGDMLSTFSTACPDAIKERNFLPKTDIQVFWIAPPKGSECVLIWATVVESVRRWYSKAGALTKKLCEELKESDDFQAPPLPKCCACDEAKYEVTFEGLWSRNTHPKSFPDNTWLTRFSDIIGASHSVDYKFWAYNETASEGLKNLAENGNTTTLESELKAESKHIRTIIKARGISHPNTTSRTFAVFRVDSRHHLISLVSMIQPSPDWIVGVSGMELCLKNCSWMDSKIFNLYPWDAGTHDGITYIVDKAKDTHTYPRLPVRSLRYEDETESPFYDEGGAPLKPLARLILSRQRLYEKNCDDVVSTEESGYCQVTDWGEWSCNVYCGKGVKLRQRAYKRKDPDYSRQQIICKKKLTERANCWGAQTICRNKNMQVTNPGCELTQWGQWSTCSAICGNGTQTRSRRYRNRNAAKTCAAGVVNPPRLQQNIECYAGECESTETREEPEECFSRNWSEWSPCSRTCGRGFKSRHLMRNYNNDEDKCEDVTESVECLNDEVPTCEHNSEETDALACGLPRDVGLCRSNVDRWYFNNIKGKCELFSYSGCEGNSNNFRTLEKCERVCGDYQRDLIANRTAQKRQLGATVSGVLAYNMQLQNDAAVRENCGANYGAVDCEVSRWSSWSRCEAKNAICGKGLKTKTRTIMTEARNGGRPCPRKLQKEKECRIKCLQSLDGRNEEEDVDCEVSEWSAWTPCSQTCGYAVRQRTRAVLIAPKGEGMACPSRFQEEPCNLNTCIDD